MKLLLLILALVVGQLCWAEETTTQKTKNDTAPGRHYSREHHHRHRGGYGHESHEKHYRAPVIDDYVCDLEATILVVSSKHHVKEEKSHGQQYGGNQNYGGGNQGYGGNQQYGGGNQQYGGGNQQYGGGNQGYGGGNQNYDSSPSYGGNQGYGSSPSYGGNQGYGGDTSPAYGGEKHGYENKPKRHEYATPEALRLKCSHIAIHSEHDCQTCCKLSARRYHSVSRNDIFGFIVDSSEIKYDDKGYVRSKRSSNYENQPSAPAQGYGSDSTQGYEQDYQGAPEYSTQAPGHSSDSSYPAAKSSYSSSSYGYNYPPKNARCVCCSPKREHHRHHDYDRSDSHEY